MRLSVISRVEYECLIVVFRCGHEKMMSSPCLASAGRVIFTASMACCFIQQRWTGGRCHIHRLSWRVSLISLILLAFLTTAYIIVIGADSALIMAPSPIAKYRYQHQHQQHLNFKNARSLKLKSRQDLTDGSTRNRVWDPSYLLDQHTVGPECSNQLLIFITSSTGNFDRRSIIRRSWGQKISSNQRYDWQYVFIIGRSVDQTVSAQIMSEMSEYNDILLGGYRDTYRNLTYKVFHALSWARTYCPRTKFIFKTDDDCFVNTVILPQLVQDYHLHDRGLYLGKVFTRTIDLNVLRSRESVWSVSVNDYPEPYYPPYASGIGYLLSVDVVAALLERSRYIKPFPVEDAYVGVVLSSLGIRPVHSDRFTFQSLSWSVCNLMYLLVVHHVDKNYQHKFYQMAQNAQRLCAEPLITEWN